MTIIASVFNNATTFVGDFHINKVHRFIHRFIGLVNRYKLNDYKRNKNPENYFFKYFHYRVKGLVLFNCVPLLRLERLFKLVPLLLRVSEFVLLSSFGFGALIPSKTLLSFRSQSSFVSHNGLATTVL